MMYTECQNSWADMVMEVPAPGQQNSDIQNCKMSK